MTDKLAQDLDRLNKSSRNFAIAILIFMALSFYLTMDHSVNITYYDHEVQVNDYYIRFSVPFNPEPYTYINLDGNLMYGRP